MKSNALANRLMTYVRSISYWVLFLSCPAYGLLLASLPDLRIYKVLNLIGVVWSILGVVTASYLILASEKVQTSALRISSYLFAILLVQVPFGLAFGGVFALILKYPSAKAAFTIGGYLMWPGVASFFLFANFLNPVPKHSISLQKQVVLMGGYFLLSGMLAQFVGAVFDLIDFNG